ncbi:MAG: acyl-CoA thioester hydrolase/BAAT C-terminal domain-containing protein [Solirubrobacteraceae bacterium]
MLSLAYFKAPGLPQQLLRVRLEYFRRALVWLGNQPQVDSHHLIVLGVSRGSEAALLSGAYFPSLVHAVISMVPSDVAICSYPGCRGPAWTYRGRAVPFTRELDTPQPTDDPAAVIPVQRIRGPVFLDCATADQIGTSCPYARAIIHHLDADPDRYRHVLYSYANAGHGIGSLTPYEPTAPAMETAAANPEVDRQARAQDWPRLLDFLAAFSRSHS